MTPTVLSSKGYRLIQTVINNEVTYTSNSILRVYDNASICTDRIDSSDYQEYLAWLAEGNEPLPADEQPQQEEPQT